MKICKLSLIAKTLFIVILFSWFTSGVLAAQKSPQPYNGGEFHKFFWAGGWLVWLILLPLSVITVSLIVRYLLELRRGRLLPKALPGRIKKIIDTTAEGHYQRGLDYLSDEDSFLSRVLYAGLEESGNGRDAVEIAMAETLEQNTTALLRRIEWLNIIGNVAPMIGLLGTVWGMINAFSGIVRAGGQPEPADLAGGISTALVTTWWGLVVAIPALAVYGLLRNRIDSLSAETAVTSEKLLRKIHTNCAKQ